jgi:Tol biopolymer transport system component
MRTWRPCAAAVLAVNVYGLASPAPQDAAPELFAPGIVSTEAPEFAVAFSPDGREVYFNRATADRSSFPIFRSTLRGSTWSPPEPVPFAPDGRNPDPFVTSDGTRLYFSSNRPKAGSGAPGDFDLWYVERQGSGWGPAGNVGPPVNSVATDVFASLTRDGTMYFGSDRNGRSEIFRSRRTGGGFGEPERLPDAINAGGAGNPAISADERWLVFVATRPGGLGEADLYVSERRNGRWTEARNLGARVNSPQADFAPAFGPDGRRLYFTSERPGIVQATSGGRPPGDIYWIDRSAAGIR